MKLSIARSGGFAGIREPLLELDTLTLKPAAAAKIAQTWQSLRARIQASSGKPSIGADFLKYEIVVSDEHGRELMEVVDDGGAVAAELLLFIQACG
ncbi:MAG: hypothetical protein HY286_19375 [Planctomycetes bacterium]|nr:hypothetical protein [Planctomycetota bacterium]